MSAQPVTVAEADALRLRLALRQRAGPQRRPEPVPEDQARRSLLAFTRRTFPRYAASWHHERIAEKLEAVERGEITRLMIFMPPRHGKTELASIRFPAWYLGRNPDRRVITCSYSAALATRLSRQARNLLTLPEWPWPHRLAHDSASAQAWDIAGHRGGLIAAGVGGPITGSGAHLLIIDDPVKNAEEAGSPTSRESVWDWYTSTAYTRLEDGGAIILVQTRWHHDDLAGRLHAAAEQGGDRWDVLTLPALDVDGNALWPDKYDAEALDSIKRAVGSRVFTSLYQQAPSDEEGAIFKRHWWRRYGALPTLTRVEQFADSAFKEGVANDYSVVATWGTDGAGNYYVLDVRRGRYAYPDLVRAFHDAHAAHKHRAATVPLTIEDKASGQSAIQTLSRPLPTASGATLPRLPVLPFPRDKDRREHELAALSKVARAEQVSALVEAGAVYLPEDAPWVADFIAEHEQFPNGAHDDQVDTTSMALIRLTTERRRMEVFF